MTVKLEVTSEAQNQVRELIRAQKPGTAVRVFLQAGGGGGGGCGCGSGGCGGGSSGPTFGMAFDRQRNGDEVIPVNGFSVVADSFTAEQLDGAKIDFVQELNQSGFRILPKDAPAMPAGKSGGGGCGCGSGGCC